jgi:hypothetical protein
MSKPLPGDTSLADLIWVPGEGSGTGNMTGGRKFARHYFVACHTSERGAPFSTASLPHRTGYAAGNSGPSTRTANTTVADLHSPMALGALSPVRALLHGCYRQRELKLCAVFPV